VTPLSDKHLIITNELVATSSSSSVDLPVAEVASTGHIAPNPKTLGSRCPESPPPHSSHREFVLMGLGVTAWIN